MRASFEVSDGRLPLMMVFELCGTRSDRSDERWDDDQGYRAAYCALFVVELIRYNRENVVGAAEAANSL